MMAVQQCSVAAPASEPARAVIAVLPGGAIQISVPRTHQQPGGVFVTRSTFTEPGPILHTFGVAHNKSDWDVTVDERKSGKLWKVTAKAAAYKITRTVSVTPTRVNVSDTIETLENATDRTAVVGVEVRHVLAFPDRSVVRIV